MKQPLRTEKGRLLLNGLAVETIKDIKQLKKIVTVHLTHLLRKKPKQFWKSFVM
ncbi:hypothetical protein ABQD97_06955 [Enterococcus avium]|uniref:Uncharacterized protein n=1 Tax=Enterococcus avium TaxID=33945 RepID=A0ABD5F8Y8_ENTAV|nr:hypothetical protein [Enterococcus avium]MDT2397114.1 hypothetical protein [Enterococcus avium]MDT2435002.1 hypothetical protein [Enterococcus avium]MDT2449259.1 hypothetical protein [Enterococcus avium]MDT2465301.1 hypothetical protein [Enterococcus avium]MDT2469567.1 hypothetical protein [Enterococcus avium]